MEDQSDSDTVNNFNSDNSGEEMDIEDDKEEEKENIINMNQNTLYNSQIYNFNFVYSYFKTNKILKDSFICSNCHNIMKIENNNSFLDKIMFRCRSKNPSHDIKINIRKDSIFENVRMSLVSIYFLIYECFINNKSIAKSYIEYQEFKNHINVDSISQIIISKLYSILRTQIRKTMHANWSINMLGENISTGGVPRLEIDESKIIGNQNKVYWMFGIIDRSNKDCRVFCVLDNRSRESLLPIIIKNVYTYNDLSQYNTSRDIHKYSLSTRIYSDCWAAYSKEDFKNEGYILHRVNHTVWFGKGLFHTNTIEGLWSQIKRLNNNFSGLNFEIINQLENKGISAIDYLNDWICWSLYLRICELKKYNKFNKIIELNKYLKY